MNTLSKLTAVATVALVTCIVGCKPRGAQSAVGGDAAQKTYVAPGKYDEFYDFVSGGFSGQMSVYGLPSGRLFRVIPVFSVDPEKGYGYSEETKAMIHFVRSGSLQEAEISQKLLINFQKQNDFIDVSKAFLLVSPEMKTPMGGNAAAFASQQEAEKMKNTAAGEVLNWNDVLKKLE